MTTDTESRFESRENYFMRQKILKNLSTLKYYIGIAVLGIGCPAMAQTTGGVIPPNVNEGHQSLRYRGAYNPSTGNFQQRFHYQEALNDDFMIRGVIQTRKTDESDVDIDFFQTELFWDLSKDTDRWRTGLRFDARIRTEGRPGQIGANWLNRWKLSNDWEGRFVVLSALNVGDDAPEGVSIQTRGAINYTGFDRFQTGLELYSSLGSTNQFNAIKNQAHSFGPTLSLGFDNGISLFGGPLIGLTDAAQDFEFRIWLTKNL